MTEYSDLNSYLKKRFGTKIYKAAVSLDVTCPNRDGSKAFGGCSFCSSGGSGEFSQDSCLDIRTQLDLAIGKVSSKAGHDPRYIAYFQSFSNTYIDPAILRNKLMEAASHPLVVMISVATRPDCLPEGILEVLKEVSREIPLMVELGLQTIDDEVAANFNRCYKTSEFDEAVIKLKEIGVEVVAHVIFGLPGEDRDMMLKTVKHLVRLKPDGVKFTCLYILKDTPMEKEYSEGRLRPLEKDEYFDIVEDALRLLTPDIIVHRLTGDGPKSLLIAPLWTADKRNVVNYINRRFSKRKIKE